MNDCLFLQALTDNMDGVEASLGKTRKTNSMALNIIQKIDQEQIRHDHPAFRSGDTVKVHIRIIEGEKERIQIFQGVVLKRKRGDMNASFTVRKISHGVGVEKTFALNSPRLDKIEVVTLGRVRRSRLYYLRERRGKAARIKERGYI
jgi:large subunit ribosomal protein L19